MYAQSQKTGIVPKWNCCQEFSISKLAHWIFRLFIQILSSSPSTLILLKNAFGILVRLNDSVWKDLLKTVMSVSWQYRSLFLYLLSWCLDMDSPVHLFAYYVFHNQSDVLFKIMFWATLSVYCSYLGVTSLQSVLLLCSFGFLLWPVRFIGAIKWLIDTSLTSD